MTLGQWLHWKSFRGAIMHAHSCTSSKSVSFASDRLRLFDNMMEMVPGGDYCSVYTSHCLCKHTAGEGIPIPTEQC